jgi:hypothetical protein
MYVAMLVRDTTYANGVSIIIKAKNTRVRFGIVDPGVGIQGDERNHVPHLENVGGMRKNSHLKT